MLFAQLALMEPVPNTLSATVVHDGSQRDLAIDKDIDVDVGDHVTIHFRALETHQATYVVAGLPPSAQAMPADDGIDIFWTPIDEDAGMHEIVLHVTDGPNGAERKIRMSVEHTHHSIFMPGAIASTFVPNDATHLGAFVGGGVEIVLYAFLQRGHRWFPSHGRFYFDFEVLASTEARVDPLVSGALGFDLTLEQSPRRRFLLPFLGGEIGFAYQQKSGSFGWGMPLAGIYLYASPFTRVALRGGYLLPTTSDDNVRGVRVALSWDIAGW